MVYVNKFGYLERKHSGARSNTMNKGTKRSWWFVKYGRSETTGYITFGLSQKRQLWISLPKEYIGKRVKFRIEVVDASTK